MVARSVRNRFPAEKSRQDSRYLPTGPHPIFETGVDWITVTCNERASQEEFNNFGYALLSEEAVAGEEVSPWFLRGFEGLNAGKIAVGKRQETALIRLSSRLAWQHWKQAYQLSTNCSRLDLQVTVGDVFAIDEYLRDKEREAWSHAAHFRRPPEVALRYSNRTGSTLYLGSRSSDSFGRVYNKWAESKLDHYAGCARFEVQYQNELAKRVAYRLDHADKPELEIPGAVLAWMGNRGINRPFNAIAMSNISSPRSRSNTSKRLEWLERQVKPCIASLLETVTLEECLRALGLTDRLAARGPTVNDFETKE